MSVEKYVESDFMKRIKRKAKVSGDVEIMGKLRKYCFPVYLVAGFFKIPKSYWDIYF